MPFKRAADAHRHESPVIAAQHGAALALQRARLQDLLPPHLAGDQLAFETLDLLLSVETWARLRVDQKLPVATARTILERQIAAIVG